jgi:hypothetical protein
MAQLSIPEIIELGDISVSLAANYQAEGKIFPKRLAFTAPQTIALVTDALRWQWDGFPDLTEVRATATITIDVIGESGDGITVYINDPLYGLITLGFVIQSSLTNTINLIAEQLGASIGTNSYGYEANVVNNVITITAREGLGASINGVFLTCTETSVDFLSTESNDEIITQNNLNIITQ